MRASSSAFSFPFAAAVSLAVHAGLLFGAIATARAPARNEASGAGSMAEQGSATLGGETFDIAEEAPELEERATAESVSAENASATAESATAESVSAASASEAEPIEIDDGPPRKRAASPRHAQPAARAAHANGDAPTPPPALYGAVGQRGAIDLVLAFKRAAGMADDHVWNSVPIGFYAAADITITIDESGTITHTTISPNATPALRSAIARHIAAIKGHSFTAKGARTRLHIVARVTDQVTNQGRVLFDANGCFELTSGRRVCVDAVER